MCPDCRAPVPACRCRSASHETPASGSTARVSRQTKGRGGKSVTLVEGLPLQALALAQVGRQLKAVCGSGGTLKDGVIEVQGDHCEKVVQWLRQQGHAAKRSGG